MKTTAKYLFLLLFVVVISGCSNSGGNLVWDFANSSFEIEIVDENGASLIHPKNAAGDKRLKSLRATWNNEIFRYEGLGGRALRSLPEFYHALGCKPRNSGYVLTFGQFQPHYSSTQLIKLDIPGVRTVRIAFTHFANPKGSKANVKTCVWVDEKEVCNSTPFKLRITVNRADWFRGYENIEGPMPVTIYMVSNSLLESEKLSVLHKEKEYRFDGYKEHSSSIDLGNYDEPLFYGGKSPFIVSQEEGRGEQPFLAFGPFDPKQGYKDETFTLKYGSKEITIRFSAYLGSDNELIYHAVLADNNKSPNYVYFRNGPLVRLPL